MTHVTYEKGEYPNSIGASLIRAGAYSDFRSALNREQQISTLWSIAALVLRDMVTVVESESGVRFQAVHHPSHFLIWKLEEVA